MFDKVLFKYFMEKASYTKAELAENLGMSVKTLSRKINGKTQFSRLEVQNIRLFLDLSDEDFIRVFFKGFKKELAKK